MGRSRSVRASSARSAGESMDGRAGSAMQAAWSRRRRVPSSEALPPRRCPPLAQHREDHRGVLVGRRG